MNRRIVDRFFLARRTAAAATALAVIAAGMEGVVPVWFVVSCTLLLTGTGLVWLMRLPRFDLVGPLTRTEQQLQMGVTVACLLTGLVAWRSGSSPVAVAATSVATLAGSAAVRRRDILFADVAAGGVCLLILGNGPALSQAPLLVAAWFCILISSCAAVRLAMLDGHPSLAPLEPWRRSPELPGRATAAAVAPAFAVSLITCLVAVLAFPFDDGGARSHATGSVLNQRGRAARGQTYGGPMNLNARGSLGSGQVAVVDASAPDHWRTQVLRRYDGTTFHPDPTLATGSVRATAAGSEVSALTSNGVPAGAADHTFWVRPAAGESPVMSPGHLRAVDLPVASLRLGQGSMLLATTTRPYTVSVSLPPLATQATTAGAASGAVGGESPTDAKWVELPGTVTPRTRQLAARLTAGATTVPAKVAAVQSYLHANYAYDLDSPVAPRGQDAVDHFLFDARSGFCEHFAAAETVLLRSVGVPARVAVGFAFGQVTSDGRHFTQKDAHAWTEVYEAGHGWLTSDSTASSTPADRQGIAARVHAWFQQVRARPRQRVTLIAALVALGAAGWGTNTLLARRRQRRSRRDETRTDLQRAVDRLLLALDAAGRPQQPHETLRTLTVRVPQAAAGLAVAERATYGTTGVTQQEADDAVRCIDDAARHLRERSRRRRIRV